MPRKVKLFEEETAEVSCIAGDRKAAEPKTRRRSKSPSKPKEPKDPNKPKRAPTAYNTYMQLKLAELKEQYPALSHKERWAMATSDWPKGDKEAQTALLAQMQQ